MTAENPSDDRTQTPGQTAAGSAPDRVVVDGPWRPLDPIAIGQDGEPIQPQGDLEVAAPRERALTRRVVGRWWSAGQGGRIYVLGRVKRHEGQGGDDTEPDGTRTVRAILRTAWRVWHGHGVIYGRWWDAASHGTIRRQIRAHETAGDVEKLADWVDRYRAVKRERRDRLTEMPVLIAHVTVTTAAGTAACALAVGAGGILVAITHPGGVTWSDYWAFWDLLLHLAADVVLYGGLTILCVTPLGWFAATWRAGRPGDAMPGWLAPRMQFGEREPEEITPSLVVTALRDLGLPRLTKAIKAMPDRGAGMLSLITTAGCGVELDIHLPSGTSTKDIRERHDRFAENLSRHEHEVHLMIPKAARAIRVWIAEPGALDEPIGPSPMVYDDVEADYYNGRAPWGEDLRGDAVAISLKQCHVLVTGLSNQGKTAALRALLLWLAFDPTVEFWIADLKGIGDFGMFAGLASVLIEGPADKHVIAATHMVEAGVAEMNRRIEAVQAMKTAKGVTRDMARKPGSGLHPLKIVVDEAQVAFMSPAVGDDKRPYGGRGSKSRFFQAVRQIQNQGRAVNVTIDLGTQDPTNDNLPKIVREAFHIRASLFVGTESQARMSVGEAAVDGGAAPHRLRRGLDRGTVVISGDGVPLPRGAASMTVRTHYIDGDEATELAERAKARRAPVERADKSKADEPRDLLADLDQVLGVDLVKSADVPARLRDIAPDHYRNLTGVQLREQLAKLGIKVPSTGNLWPLDPATVRTALGRRDRE